MKISDEPFEELVVKEHVYYKKTEDLIFMVAQLRAMGQPISLNWADGLVFLHNALPPANEKLTEEFLKGRIYFLNVSYSEMPEYTPVVRYKSPQGEIPVPVLNVSYSDLLCHLVKWLKSQMQKVQK
jgi:hypothetical protein